MIAILVTSVFLLWRLALPPPGVANGNHAETIVDSVSSNSRDPFAPAVQTAGEVRQVNPLERFGVRELRLVATVEGIEPPRALIEDPSGLGFVIAPGSVVGAERGTVVSIGGGRVVLETSRDPTGARLILTLAGESGKTEGP